MKKFRIGILGKTLLFTCLLVFAVAAIIVFVFSSQFLRYAEENKSIERENQKMQLVSDLTDQEPENAVRLLKKYQKSHTDFLFVLLDDNSRSLLWKSDELAAASVECHTDAVQITVLLLSETKSQTELQLAAKSLQEQLSGSKESSSVVLQEFGSKNPDITILQQIGSDDQLNFDIQLGEDGKYVLESAFSGWSDSSTNTYERSEKELRLSDGNYRLLLQQKIDHQETLQILSGILLKVVGISILPALLGSFLFAKWMTRPVKRLAKETRKMAAREKIVYDKVSHDEIGDLTKDVRSLYEQLNQSIQNLETEMELVKRMESSKRNLFAAASHELKTPVAAISALLEGMLEEVGDYKNHPKYLRECLRVTDTMGKLIGELLEIVRLEEDMVSIQIEPIELPALLSDKIPLYQAIAEGKKQQLDVCLPKGQICTADRNRLSRALDNIILNALQNTKEGKQIQIWTEEKEGMLFFNVWNEGAYIPPEQIPDLFEPFFRLDKSRSRKEGHSGLGLAITKRLLESMDLSYSLKNTDGGLLFQIKLHT